MAERPGQHSFGGVIGWAWLAPGQHAIRIDYFQNNPPLSEDLSEGDAAGLVLEMTPANSTALAVVPASLLSHPSGQPPPPLPPPSPPLQLQQQSGAYVQGLYVQVRFSKHWPCMRPDSSGCLQSRRPIGIFSSAEITQLFMPSRTGAQSLLYQAFA